MSKAKRKAAVAALITAGAIVVGSATGGAISFEARRSSKPPPYCGVICVGSAPIGEPQGQTLAGHSMTGPSR